VEVEEGLDLLLVGHGVDHEVEVVEGQVLAVVRVLLEDQDGAVQAEDRLQDPEVLGEEQEALDVQLRRTDGVELGVLLGGLHVGPGVVVVDLNEALLHLVLVEHHRLLGLRNSGCALGTGVDAGLGHRHHELLVVVLEYFALLLLLALQQRTPDHLLLDLVHPLLGIKVLCHYKIIIPL
jgi:hypothetical protein